ncbi:MAG: oxygenase MpaB family protein [Solirubrobacteraceae bacterium]
MSCPYAGPDATQVPPPAAQTLGGLTIPPADDPAWNDDGFYGPGSIAWRIVGHPASLIGGMRALMVQALEPHAMAGVFTYSDFTARPMDRLRRTIGYVHTVTFGSTGEATAAAARVRAVHSQVAGTDPVTGTTFSATDPETLLWVHLAEYHSFLVAYEAFIGGIAPDEADEYFATTAHAAELVGVPAAMIPRSRADVSEYFVRMRPKLCVSELARESIDFVRRPPLQRELLPVQVPIRASSAAAVTLLPRYVRRMVGADATAVLDLPTRVAAMSAARTLSVFLRLRFGADGHHRMVRANVRRHRFVPHAIAHGFVAEPDGVAERVAA